MRDGMDWTNRRAKVIRCFSSEESRGITRYSRDFDISARRRVSSFPRFSMEISQRVTYRKRKHERNIRVYHGVIVDNIAMPLICKGLAF